MPRANLKHLENAKYHSLCNERDSLINSVLDSDPNSLFKAVKASKSKVSSKIQSLNVGNKVYSDKAVPDGFFDSLSSLKAPDMSKIHSSPSYQRAAFDYSTIR